MLAILITPPTSHPGEAATLASLVNPTRPTQARPPTAIHVRKPGWDRDRLAAYVSGLDPAVRALVVLHSHHDLVSRLGLKGAHYTETLRAAGPVTPPPGTQTVSASLHSLADVPRGGGDLTFPWAYAFLSPVWPSVSKAGHAPGPDLGPDLIAASFAAHPPAVPVVALGGLTPDSARAVRGLGCAGGAAIGCVWGAADPVAAWGAFVEGLDAGTTGRVTRNDC